MRIILNADDFGWSSDTVRATIDCFERGALTSATLMANMPATAEAIDYARAHPDLSCGVHLTFTGDEGERPLSDPAQVRALVRDDGCFRGGKEITRLAFRRRLPVDQIAREMTAQIAYVRDHGVAISHVDGHGHIHKFASMFDAMQSVLPKFGIARVRRGQDTWIKRPLHSPIYWLGGLGHPRFGHRYRTTQHFFMPICASDTAALPGLAPRLHGESIEVGVHPGTEDGWRRAERDAVIAFAAAARATGHELLGWQEL